MPGIPVFLFLSPFLLTSKQQSTNRHFPIGIKVDSQTSFFFHLGKVEFPVGWHPVHKMLMGLPYETPTEKILRMM